MSLRRMEYNSTGTSTIEERRQPQSSQNAAGKKRPCGTSYYHDSIRKTPPNLDQHPSSRCTHHIKTTPTPHASLTPSTTSLQPGDSIHDPAPLLPSRHLRSVTVSLLTPYLLILRKLNPSFTPSLLIQKTQSTPRYISNTMRYTPDHNPHASLGSYFPMPHPPISLLPKPILVQRPTPKRPFFIHLYPTQSLS